MSLATEVKKEVRRLGETKAFYAAAGVGDLAVQRLRQVPARLSRVQVRAEEIPGAAISYMAQIGARAVEVYDELAERGKQVTGRVGRAAGTTELEVPVRPQPTHTATTRKTGHAKTAKSTTTTGH